MLAKQRPELQRPAVVLVGLESVGKSALFRGMTGVATGDEINFRGSTVTCRTEHIPELEADLVDVPGIRLQEDSNTTRTALREMRTADSIVLVVRGTNADAEVQLLLKGLELKDRRVTLVMSFADRSPPAIQLLADYYRDWLGIPVVVTNTKQFNDVKRRELLQAIREARPIKKQAKTALAPSIPAVQPTETVFEHPVWGRPVALIAVLLLFALPVFAAHALSSWLEPFVDSAVITPVKERIRDVPPFFYSLFVGDYGIVTLGWYSFLWAFPVVLFLAVTVALAEESGAKDRMTSSLDKWLKWIGLSGRDLIPALSGFGCNVVAVFQSRACSECTRHSCVSLIAFGSACSYQIGATLSLFSAAGSPILFVPYMFILFLVGAVHTRIWNKALNGAALHPLGEKSFLQLPSWRALSWRVKSVLKQFLLQAMPIFIAICAIASVLEQTGVLQRIASVAGPALQFVRLPAEAAVPVIFSVLRKDGLLLLNEGEGTLLQAMSTGQLFVLVYLASTLTACLVTLWTVRKEMGLRFALTLGGKQLITSVISTLLLAIILL